MKWIGMKAACALALAGLWATVTARAETHDLPQLQELLRLVRSHLPGVTEEELDRSAAQGLLDGLRPRVQLLTNGIPAPPPESLITRTAVHDRVFAYARIAEVASGLPEQFMKAWNALGRTQNLKGLVLDLRFAGGEDYGAAAGLADCFLTNAGPLIHCGGQTWGSTAKTNAIGVPLVVLANSGTAGAAEALAEALRSARAGLIVGRRTAGHAYAFQEFELGPGRRLRVAATAVRVEPDQALAEGVAPDIEVGPGAVEEKAWFEDPYWELAEGRAPTREGGEAAAAPGGGRLRPRINEAELVRRQRDRGLSGLEGGPASGPAPAGAGERTVQDPALARALDLLRALALVGRFRPS